MEQTSKGRPIRSQQEEFGPEALGVLAILAFLIIVVHQPAAHVRSEAPEVGHTKSTYLSAHHISRLDIAHRADQCWLP